MRVCLILEGCYPYIRGGVSSWAHDYISSNPDVEYVLWTIHASREYVGEPVYKLPSNVVSNHEVFLEDASRISEKGRIGKTDDSCLYVDCLKRFVDGTETNWDDVFFTCCSQKRNISNIVNSDAFLDFAKEYSVDNHRAIGLATSYYGLKSMFLPLIHLMNQDVPEADVYHSAVAGYGGILGSIAKFKTGKPYILTEHGIYPREREEELVQSEWVSSAIRSSWILSFYNFSRCAYYYADRVTALFREALERQVEIGCDLRKCVVISNGIHTEMFDHIPNRENNTTVNIGAFVRFAPIKDVKTLIYSFANLTKQLDNVHLHILGSTDDELYKKECESLIDRLRIKNIFIDGYVDTAEFIKDMDFTVLTSISEGQPLAILESFAAGKPCIATRVGNCESLLLGDRDGIGAAGICCNPMDVDAITEAMIQMSLNEELRIKMGINGRKRVLKYYSYKTMNSRYRDIYDEVCGNGGHRI